MDLKRLIESAPKEVPVSADREAAALKLIERANYGSAPTMIRLSSSASTGLEQNCGYNVGFAIQDGRPVQAVAAFIVYDIVQGGRSVGVKLVPHVLARDTATGELSELTKQPDETNTYVLAPQFDDRVVKMMDAVVGNKFHIVYTLTDCLVLPNSAKDAKSVAIQVVCSVVQMQAPGANALSNDISKMWFVARGCSWCKRYSAALRKCKACLKMAYCSRDCQMLDWTARHSAAATDHPSLKCSYLKTLGPDPYQGV